MINLQIRSATKVRLTEREMEIAHLLSRGNSRAEIIHRLSLAESTVDKHLRRIKDRLGARSMTDLVLAARSHVEGVSIAAMEQHLPIGTTGAQASLPIAALAPLTEAVRPASSATHSGTDLAALTTASDFSTLFSALERAMAQLGLPLLAWCHVTRRPSGTIAMENARLNFRTDALADLSLRAEVNPIFLHTMSQWMPLIVDGPTPLIAVPLPGASLHDRIVAVVAPRDGQVDGFRDWAVSVLPTLSALFLTARNCHLALSQRGANPDLMALTNALATGETMDDAARMAGLSRRSAERLLTTTRQAMRCRSNMELICLLRQQSGFGRFDFGMSPP